MNYVCTNRHSMVTVRKSPELLPPDACDISAFPSSLAAIYYAVETALENKWELDADEYDPELIKAGTAFAKNRKRD